MLWKNNGQEECFDHKREKAVAELRQEFSIDQEEVCRAIIDFHADMRKGLSGEASSLKMLPAFVGPPTGKEEGKFLALDFGGTNCRVLSVELGGNGRVSDVQLRKFVIPPECIRGSQEDLFGFIAESVDKFHEEMRLSRLIIRKLGFTFSFPIDQGAIDSGKLILWTKDFDVDGVVGQDVVLLLRRALRKKDVRNIEITCLANDTVGTLANHRYQDVDCDIGVILGTGTNGAYVEKTANIRKLDPSRKIGEKMLINVEWGEFDKFRRTRHDRILDERSNNQGHAFLEKTVSGKYLGSLVSIIAEDLIRRGSLFDSNGGSPCRRDWLDAEDVIVMAHDHSRGLLDIKRLLQQRIGREGFLVDRLILREISRAVFARSVKTAATAIASLLLWIDPKLERPHTVAIDGSLFEKAPGYGESLREELQGILGEKGRGVELVLSKDGSGIGAAIIAATISANY